MFDTTEANTAFYNAILAHMGKPPLSASQFEFAHMATVAQAMAMLFPEEGEHARAQEYRRELTYTPFLPMMRMEPHLRRVLSELRPRYRTAVSTNRTDTMHPVLAVHGLADLFDCVVTAMDVERPKPHPDPLQKVLSLLSLSPDQAVYVGDTAVDSRAALEARVPFIAFADRRLPAARHISSLDELFRILPAKA